MPRRSFALLHLLHLLQLLHLPPRRAPAAES